MRTYAEIEKDAHDVPAFSNGTSAYAWTGQWCERCQAPAEKMWRDYESGKRKKDHSVYPGGCPLLMMSMVGKTPIEWLEQPCGSPDEYHCIEFVGPDDGRGRGGGGREPRPKPEPTGMDGLFERPVRRRRMLTQSPVRELVDA